MTTNITVAQAAALINVAVILFTLSFPLLITLVTVGSLKKNVNAATWSVFSRLANQSLWPNILRTDAAGTKKVDGRIRALSLLATVGAIALAFSAAVTPLGLHTASHLKEPEDTLFTYVRDDSVIGQGTSARSGYSFSRVCGLFTACPGNTSPWHTWRSPNSLVFNYSNPTHGTISTSIADNITNVFSSATKHSRTVAGIFDIEYRNFDNYNTDSDPLMNLTNWRDHGHPRTQGQFWFHHDFIVDSNIQAVEGLIVSTTDRPGIGFRNHTLPPSSEDGYVWSEDILWLEPETACTGLNITFDYKMPAPGAYYGSYMKGNLVDRGGFVNLGNEWWSTRDWHYNRTKTQDEQRLLAKSWKAATLTNAVTFGALNKRISSWNDSFIGKEYPVDELIALALDPELDPRRLSFSSYGEYSLAWNSSFSSYWNPSLPPPLNIVMHWTNLSNTTKMDDSEIGNFVLPWTWDIADIDIAGMAGGLVLAAGTQLDTRGNKMPSSGVSTASPDSKWSRPLYSCVSAVKASVKTVDFEFKGPASLSRLHIKSVNDKHYKSKNQWPLWAVERIPSGPPDLGPDRAVSPFWGIVSEDVNDLPGIMTLRKPSFHLPVPRSQFSWLGQTVIDSVAGANAPVGYLSSIYDSIEFADIVPELMESNDGRLLERFAHLSADATSAAKLLDLLWTDFAANALVGTKSVLSRPDGGKPKESALMPARAYESGLAYDWRYAIPALAFATLYAALLAWSLILFCARRMSFTILRFMLNQSTAGRSMTTERYQASAEADFADTKKWANIRGGEMVRMTMADADRKSQKSPSYSLLTTSQSESRSSMSIRFR